MCCILCFLFQECCISCVLFWCVFLMGLLQLVWQELWQTESTNGKVVKLSIADSDPSGSACCQWSCCSAILCIFAYALMYKDLFNLNHAKSCENMKVISVLKIQIISIFRPLRRRRERWTCSTIPLNWIEIRHGKINSSVLEFQKQL